VKPFHLIIVAVGLISQTGIAFSASQKLINGCAQNDNWDLKLSACSKLLADNQFASVKKRRVFILVSRSSAHFWKFEFSHALADANDAIDVDHNSSAAWMMRGTAHRAMGDFSSSIEDYNRALALGASKPIALNNRAQAETDLKDYDRALKDLTEAIELNPKLDTAYALRASVWASRSQDYDNAISDLSKAIALNNPKSSNYLPKSANYYSNRGTQWRHKGDLDQALRDANHGVELDPSHAYFFYVRGDIYRYLGNYSQALSDYDHALAIEPDAITAFVDRGLTYEKMGDTVRARAEFQKALSSKSEYRADDRALSLETARARLAALDSGTTQPLIAPVPIKATNPNSIPTAAPTAPAAVNKTATSTGRRVALVFGNSSYKRVPELLNPKNDADAVARTLRAIGFNDVTLEIDDGHEKMVAALQKFADQAEGAEWALVYYAGHGIEMGGQNYLIPIDAELATDRAVQFEAVPFDQVMSSIEGARKLKLVLLDACRDNPFEPKVRQTASADALAPASTVGARINSRSIGRGLAEVKVSGATLVVFAAKQGQVALDGEGDDSPFAIAVVQRIATPGVEINKIFRLVRDDVMEATAGRQEPYTYGSLPGSEDFYFVAKQ
jgi:tetratricopeptide (TPR) repeat protein